MRVDWAVLKHRSTVPGLLSLVAREDQTAQIGKSLDRMHEVFSMHRACPYSHVGELRR